MKESIGKFTGSIRKFTGSIRNFTGSIKNFTGSIRSTRKIITTGPIGKTIRIKQGKRGSTRSIRRTTTDIGQ